MARKWLFIGLILACLIGGLSFGGYYVYNQVTSTVELPNPPVQPEVVAPATSTETPAPTQSSDQMPVLEVAWEEIQLPPMEFGFDSIPGLIVENGGNTVFVYRCVGPANNGTATLFSLWKTADGCRTWNEVERVILHSEEEKELGFLPQERSWGGDPHNQYFSEREELIRSMPDPLTDFGNPYSVNEDPNNPDNILVVSWYVPTDGSAFIRSSDLVARLFVSIDGHWYQTNFPPCFAPYDAYPETPQLTLLKDFPANVSIRIISTDDGSVELYIVPEARGVFWKATANLKSPN